MPCAGEEASPAEHMVACFVLVWLRGTVYGPALPPGARLLAAGGLWRAILYVIGISTLICTVLKRGRHRQEFSDSGAFSWTDRVVSSLRNNLVFYAVLAERHAPL